MAILIPCFVRDGQKLARSEKHGFAKSVTLPDTTSWDEGSWQYNSSSHQVTPRNLTLLPWILAANTIFCGACRMQVARSLWCQLSPRLIRLWRTARWGILSNGPGDPAATASYAGAEIAKLIAANMPVFGICIGHQLMALALGAKTHKMARGHRGANHPVRDLQTGKIEITSQNHGFAVDPDSLPADLEVTHISLFDQSIEGLRHKTKPAFCVQYHPESSPGHMTHAICLSGSPT